MSRKSLVWSIVIIAAVFMAASALTFGPEAWANPRDGGRDISPGGWPAKVRSYYVHGAEGVWLTAIPSVEGPNGFMVTGIDFFILASNSHVHMAVDTASGNETVYSSYFVFSVGHPPYVRFDPGIPVPAGAAVRLMSNTGANDVNFTLSGYVY